MKCAAVRVRGREEEGEWEDETPRDLVKGRVKVVERRVRQREAYDVQQYWHQRYCCFRRCGKPDFDFRKVEREWARMKRRRCVRKKNGGTEDPFFEEDERVCGEDVEDDDTE